MDFLDPEKQKKHARRIAIGYVLLGLTLVLATTILLYRAYGYSVDKEGRVIQNGLVFVSSRPSEADLYINGKKYKDQTNTRLNLPSGQYAIEIRREGYHSWKRLIPSEGGRVDRYDYPLLFPVSLTTVTTKRYGSNLGLATQSLDRRWLLTGAADQNSFDLFDLDAKSPTPKAETVPAEALAAGSVTKSWEAVEWSADDRHVLLKRTYEKTGQSAMEYILFDRQDPALTQNLSVVLGFTPTKIELRAGAYDQYYVHDQTSGELFTASLKKPTPQPLISDVVLFTAERDLVLYVTAEGAPTGKALIRMQKDDDEPVTLRQVPLGTTYLLDVANYDDAPHVAVGAQSEDRVYVYRDPISALRREPKTPLVPLQILRVTEPSYVSFSPDKRFVVAENADRFAVYDVETDRHYSYQIPAAMDAPQVHASWVDGFRMTYVSRGKLVLFDYDGSNQRTLVAANPNFLPAFARDYRLFYTFNQQNILQSTSLLTPQDL